MHPSLAGVVPKGTFDLRIILPSKKKSPSDANLNVESFAESQRRKKKEQEKVRRNKEKRRRESEKYRREKNINKRTEKCKILVYETWQWIMKVRSNV